MPADTAHTEVLFIAAGTLPYQQLPNAGRAGKGDFTHRLTVAQRATNFAWQTG